MKFKVILLGRISYYVVGDNDSAMIYDREPDIGYAECMATFKRDNENQRIIVTRYYCDLSSETKYHPELYGKNVEEIANWIMQTHPEL